MLKAILQACIAWSEDDKKETKISNAIPDVVFTDQFGDELHFRRDIVDEGYAVLVNSVYTRCRGSCPITNGRIEKLRPELTRIFGQRIKMFSFTLEPEYDTPSVLLDYAANFGAGRKRPDLCDWHFVNAPRTQMEAFRRSIGFFELNPLVDSDVTQHAGIILAGNPVTDRWAAFPAELRQAVLMESICRTAGFTFEQRYGISG